MDQAEVQFNYILQQVSVSVCVCVVCVCVCLVWCVQMNNESESMLVTTCKHGGYKALSNL